MLKTLLQYIRHVIEANREYRLHLRELNSVQEAREENENFFADIIDKPGKHRKKTEWNE